MQIDRDEFRTNVKEIQRLCDFVRTIRRIDADKKDHYFEKSDAPLFYELFKMRICKLESFRMIFVLDRAFAIQILSDRYLNADVFFDGLVSNERIDDLETFFEDILEELGEKEFFTFLQSFDFIDTAIENDVLTALEFSTELTKDELKEKLQA